MSIVALRVISDGLAKSVSQSASLSVTGLLVSSGKCKEINNTGLV